MTYLETVAHTINSLMKKNSKCIYLGEDVKVVKEVYQMGLLSVLENIE